MEVMESDLTCCVCLEIFVYPLMLPCTHNLCRRCVQGLTREGAVGKFNCPKCRLEVQTERQKGIDSLPRNLALDNLANLFRNKARITAERSCIVHNKSLDFYCQTCKCLVCSDCSSANHKEFPHNVASMKQLINKEKSSVLDLTHQINDIEAELNKNIRVVQRLTKDVKATEESNCRTIEQKMDQLIASLSTMKEAFIKRIQRETQEQVHQLKNLEQDYRRLQLDICALRSQLGYQDTTDLIQQYTSYQNIRMRASSFLAFKLFNVAAPPLTLSAHPVWKLHNAEDVYQAIQALDIHSESSYSVKRDAQMKVFSKSVPASLKYAHRPLHRQNSEEYISGQTMTQRSHSNSIFGNNQSPSVCGNTFQVKQENMTEVESKTGKLNAASGALTLPLSSLTPTRSAQGFSQDRVTPVAGNDFSRNTENMTENMLHKNDRAFGGFLKDFAINSNNFVAGSRLESATNPKREREIESRNLGRTTDLTESSTGGAVVSRGTITKTKRHTPSTHSHDRTKNTDSLGNDRKATQYGDGRVRLDDSCYRFPLVPPCNTDKNDKHGGNIYRGYRRSSSLDNLITEAARGCEIDATHMTFGDIFDGQAFSFTVGISDKGQKVRGGKGQKKRDHSIGRLHPNKQKYK